jgi:hypothetical protein
MPEAGDPRVSVLMAAYNCERFVERAVASVLAQTLTDFELVLVDDGSTDGSPAILRRLAAQDNRIMLHHQANRGIGGAMNKALELARAPLVAILDSDDLMLPTRLEAQVGWMDGHPEVAAAGSQFQTIDLEDKVIGIDRHPTDPILATHLMFGFFCLHHPTLIARRSALLEVGGYAETHRRGSPDYGLFMQLVLAGYQVSNLPHVLTSWRHTPTGATFGHAREQTTDALEIRARGFATLTARSPAKAREISLTLAGRFGAGTELDEKARWLGLAVETQPAVAALLGAPGGTGMSEAEEAALIWFNEGHSAHFGDALRRAGHLWLASLLAAREGQSAAAESPAGGFAFEAPAEAGLLSLLLPLANDPGTEIRARVAAALAVLPTHSELLVFSPEADAELVCVSVSDPRLRVIEPKAGTSSARWCEALGAARGEYLSTIEWTGAHSPGFLDEARTLLQAQACLDLVHAHSGLYFPDAFDETGQPLADPAPEPRWTRDTLLGRKRVRLQDLVLRRRLLTHLPLAPAECGSELPSLLAHALLLYGRCVALPHRNRAVVPPAGQGAGPMALSIERLVLGYLDSWEGLIPPREQWPALDPARWRLKLEALDRRAAEASPPVHPGNLKLLLDFILGGTAQPLLHLSLRRLLRSHPAVTLEALRTRGAAPYLGARLWSLLQRVLVRAKLTT